MAEAQTLGRIAATILVRAQVTRGRPGCGKTAILRQLVHYIGAFSGISVGYASIFEVTAPAHLQKPRKHRWQLCAKHSVVKPLYSDAVKAHGAFATLEDGIVKSREATLPHLLVLDDIDLLCEESTVSGISQSESLIALLDVWNCSDCSVFTRETAVEASEVYGPDRFVPGFSPQLTLVCSCSDENLVPLLFKPFADAVGPEIMQNIRDEHSAEWSEVRDMTALASTSDMLSSAAVAKLASIAYTYPAKHAAEKQSWRSTCRIMLTERKAVAPSPRGAPAAEYVMSWGEVVGFEATKALIRHRVIIPFIADIAPVTGAYERERARLSALSVKAPTGVLLCGASGRGKTAFAKAIATACGVNTLLVQCTQLISMYVGDSEGAVRQVFNAARQLSPCVLILDNVDTIASNRLNTPGQASSDVQSRMLSTLLNELDGVGSRKAPDGRSQQLLVLATTSRTETLDAALLRAGRLELHIEVPLPTPEDIVALLHAEIGKPIAGPESDRERILEALHEKPIATILRLAKAVKTNTLFKGETCTWSHLGAGMSTT